MKTIRALVAACITSAAAFLGMPVAQAAPVTFHFTGEITDIYRYQTESNETVPANSTISGSVTMDLSNGEHHSAAPSWVIHRNVVGCFILHEGTCITGVRNAPAVLPRWQVDSGLIPSVVNTAPPDAFTFSQVQQDTFVPAGTQIQYWSHSTRNESFRFGEVVYRYIDYAELILRFVDVDRIYPMRDLAAPIYLADMEIASFTLLSYHNWNYCNPGCSMPFYDENSVLLEGRITSLWFEEGIAIPEPDSLALGGIALAAMMALRTRSPGGPARRAST